MKPDWTCAVLAAAIAVPLGACSRKPPFVCVNGSEYVRLGDTYVVMTDDQGKPIGCVVPESPK